MGGYFRRAWRWLLLNMQSLHSSFGLDILLVLLLVLVLGLPLVASELW
jgi:hypothetical protein